MYKEYFSKVCRQQIKDTLPLAAAATTNPKNIL
jgi:hypothetical protein